MKVGPSEGSFAALSETEAAKVCAQLCASWKHRGSVFDENCDDLCGPSKEPEILEDSEQVRVVSKDLEDVQLGELQKEASEVNIKAEQESEGALLRKHHNVAGEDVEDKKVK